MVLAVFGLVQDPHSCRCYRGAICKPVRSWSRRRACPPSWRVEALLGVAAVAVLHEEEESHACPRTPPRLGARAAAEARLLQRALPLPAVGVRLHALRRTGGPRIFAGRGRPTYVPCPSCGSSHSHRGCWQRPTPRTQPMRDGRHGTRGNFNGRSAVAATHDIQGLFLSTGNKHGCKPSTLQRLEEDASAPRTSTDRVEQHRARVERQREMMQAVREANSTPARRTLAKSGRAAQRPVGGGECRRTHPLLRPRAARDRADRAQPADFGQSPSYTPSAPRRGDGG